MGVARADLIVNGGAETGDTTGWISGGIEAVVSTGQAFGFGNFVFTGGSGDAGSQTLQQDVDVSIWSDEIDNGEITSLFSIQLQARTAEGLFDSAEVTLSFLNDSALEIESVFFQDDFDIPFQWDLYSDTRIIPTGTRSIRVLLDTGRNGGLSSDGFFDEVSLTIVPEPATASLLTLLSCLVLTHRNRK